MHLSKEQNYCGLIIAFLEPTLIFSMFKKKKKKKANAQFVQKVTFEPSFDFKRSHYGSWKYYKSCYL